MTLTLTYSKYLGSQYAFVHIQADSYMSPKSSLAGVLQGVFAVLKPVLRDRKQERKIRANLEKATSDLF